MKPFPASHKWRILHFSWIAFCCTFFAWFAFPPVAMLIQKDLALSNIQIGWLATAGVLLTIPGRILIGRLVDRFGPRKTYSFLLAGLSVPVACLGLVQNFEQLLFLRLMIGLVGCGFVIGIRLIADWFPAKQVGLAEGIYGGWGNAGSAVAALSIPALAMLFSWRLALSLAAVPMLVWSVIFWFGVSDVPAGKVFRRTPRESTYSPWKDKRAMILAVAYLATFGSELCVVSFLPKYFYDKFEIAPIGAGIFASIFGLMNVFARPGGGWLADKFGRKNVLVGLIAGMAIFYTALGLAPTLWLAVAAVAVASFFVQAGEGAVFAIVPMISPTNTGRIAGIVGAAGNVGGVCFPLAFGYGMTWFSGSYLPGFLILSVAGAIAACCVCFLRIDESKGHAEEPVVFDAPGAFTGPVRMRASNAA